MCLYQRVLYLTWESSRSVMYRICRLSYWFFLLLSILGLQRCPSGHSMRSGGSCWSWLWWGSSSFWSWSSHFCCMDKAPSTRPVALVRGRSFLSMIGNALNLSWNVFLSPKSSLIRSVSSGAPLVPSADYHNALHFLRCASLHMQC